MVAPHPAAPASRTGPTSPHGGEGATFSINWSRATVNLDGCSPPGRARFAGRADLPTRWGGLLPTRWGGLLPARWGGLLPTRWGGLLSTRWGGLLPTRWGGC